MSTHDLSECGFFFPLSMAVDGKTDSNATAPQEGSTDEHRQGDEQKVNES
jgi:hypothetical protein